MNNTLCKRLILAGVGSILYLALPSATQATPVSHENTDIRDIEPSRSIDAELNQSIRPGSLEAEKSQELAAISSEALGEIQSISVGSYLGDRPHFNNSLQASTSALPYDAQLALVTEESALSQEPRLFVAQDWIKELGDEALMSQGDRHWFIAQDLLAQDLLAQDSPELDSDVDTETLEEETADDEVVDETSDADERPWAFQFSPYAFVPVSVQGDSTVEGVTSDVDLGLDDILDLFVFAASGRFEAWYKNRFGLIFDGLYSELGAEGQDVLEGPLGLLAFDVEAEVNYEQAIFDFGLGYRTEIDNRNDDDRATQEGVPDGLFDIIAGVRVQYLKQTVDLDVEISGPNRTFDFDRDLGTDDTWVEPLLSARLRYNLSRKLGFTSRADISGFGIDGLSLTWRLLGGVDWVFAGDTSLGLGYSVFGIDYETGEGRDEFGIDQIQHGPYLAVTFRF